MAHRLPKLTTGWERPAAAGTMRPAPSSRASSPARASAPATTRRRPHPPVRPVAFAAGLGAALLLLLQPPLASASALTTAVKANEKLCFYAWVDKPLEKVGFYFAVQSGGSFEIDWVVTDPQDMIVIEGARERQGDYIFTAASVGEYTFCFNNDLAVLGDAEKLVDFDIMVESEPRQSAPAKPTSITEQTSSLEESIYKLSGSLSSIQRTQKYFRTRENRNVSTVKNTQSHLVWFSIMTSALTVGMSFLQAFIVRKFFNKPGKYVRV